MESCRDSSFGLLREFVWGQIVQGTVGSNGIVVLPPRLDDGPRLRQRREPVLIEALIPQPPVETLDIGMLDRLPRIDESQLHVMGVGPGVQGPAGEVRAVVHGDDLWKAPGEGTLVQHRDDSRSRQGRVHLCRQALPRTVVHDVQFAEPPSVQSSKLQLLRLLEGAQQMEQRAGWQIPGHESPLGVCIGRPHFSP